MPKRPAKYGILDLLGTKIPFMHLRMLQTASDNGFRFEAVQLPLNVMDGHQFRSFQHQVLPVLLKETLAYWE
jgi:hypothetical protein